MRKIRTGILLAIIIIMFLGMFIMKSEIENKEHEMGEILVSQFTMDQEQYINYLKVLLTLGTDYLGKLENEEIPHDELQDKLCVYLEHLMEFCGNTSLSFYGVVDHKIISPDNKIDKNFDYWNKAYYIAAKGSLGEIYITDVYESEFTNEPVVTLIKMIPGSGSFLAIDLAFSNLEKANLSMILPDTSSFFVVDDNGKLLYYISTYLVDLESAREQMSEIWGNVLNEDEKNHINYISPMSGKMRRAYFQEMDNGLYCILTIRKKEVNIYIQLLFWLVIAGLFYLFIANEITERSKKQGKTERPEICEKTVNMAESETEQRSKNAFLSRMSHNLRTPLNIILGMSNVALMHVEDTQKVREALLRISLTGKHLLGMINHILDMSQIENGAAKLLEKEFQVTKVLTAMTDIVRTQTTENKQRFSVRFDNITHDHVVGDEERFLQIMINILDNATKYTKAGGEIFMKVKETPSDIDGKACFEISVFDNGMGMEKSLIDQIFKPFVRGAQAENKAPWGNGLGLSIALFYARMMDGDIRINSQIGIGTEVTVFLYLKYDNSRSQRQERMEEEKSIGEMLSAYQKMDYSGRRVLVVEDNEIARILVEELLLEIHLEVEMAVDGQQALELLCEHEPGYYDLVFMDIQMPVMDGYEATRAIRASERADLRTIPIIAMTADAFEEDRKSCFAAGMNGHIAKPLEIDLLESVLKEYLGKKE